MDWIKTLPAMVFWWSWIMVAILAAGALYATWWARRNVKALGAQAPVDASDLAEGYRLAWGTTLGPALTSPLTGRRCVWWKVEVWETVRERTPSGQRQNVWRQIVEEESDRPILFGDGKTVAAVWTYGATVISSNWSDWRGNELPPEDKSPELHAGGAPARVSHRDVQGVFGSRFRYVEQIIPAQSPIFALGEAHHVDPNLYAPDEDDSEAGSVARQLADDAKHDGWSPKPSRLGVSPTPDRVIAEDMSEAKWAISMRKGKPFLLSTDHPEAVSAEQELGAKGGLIMGGIFTALALFLIWVRYAG